MVIDVTHFAVILLPVLKGRGWGEGLFFTLHSSLAQIVCPVEEWASVAVTEIVVVGIGFTLKTDVFVATDISAVLDDAHQPFQQIPDVETDEKHLALLQCVDVFVVANAWRQHTFREDYSEEVDGIETATEWDDLVVDDFHVDEIVI